MPLAIDNFSRFRDNPTILVDNVETFGAWAPPSIVKNGLSDADVIYYKVDSATEGKPHAIALEIYGTTYLDWLIIAFNKPRSTLNWPRSGDVIRVPKQAIALASVAV